MRLFVAVNFNSYTKNGLLALCDELRSKSNRGNFSLPENLHLTLAFLGECDEIHSKAVKAIMDTVEFEPFGLMIDKIGRFKRDGGDIWWAGIQESNTLFDVQGKLTNKLIAAGFSLDNRNYSPHITLGRKVAADAYPRRIEPFGETITKIELMKSERIKGKLTYTAIYSKGSNIGGLRKLNN